MMHFDLNVSTVLTTLIGLGIVWLIRTVSTLDAAAKADAVWKDLHTKSDDKGFKDAAEAVEEIREEQRRVARQLDAA